MKRALAVLLVAASLMAPAAGQTADDPNEGSQAEWDWVNTTLHLKWYGRQGRTYFIQQSTDDLGAFTYLKTVETGDDAVREWGFTTNSERTNMPTKYFVRLKWTDIPTTNGALADFDGDGLGNLADLEANADPFVADSDGDGLSDGVEASIGTKANNPDSNTNGMTDGEELLNGGDPRVPGPAPTPIAPPSSDPPVPADPPPTPPDALAPADHDILVKTESVSFPKYGFDTFQGQNPPRRYLYQFVKDFHTWSDGASEFPYGPVEMTSTVDPLIGETNNTSSTNLPPDRMCTGPTNETVTPLFWTVKASAPSEDGFWDSGYFAFLRNENTTEMMVSNAKSQLGAPTQMRALAEADSDFKAGTPFAFRNVHENELTFDYQKTQLKLKWKDGVSEEQRHAVTYLLVFEPENNPATPENESVANVEIIQTISWDGQTAESGPFTIDPDEKKPGVDGKYFLVPFELRDINDHSNTGDDETITPWDKTQNIANNNVAWIDAHTSDQNPAPRMPQLEFRMPGLPQGITIEAKLEVRYDRGNGARTARNQAEDTVNFPIEGSFKQVSGDAWEIWSEYQTEDFFGGDATLTYRLKSGSTEILPETKIDFRIGGKNPDDARCRAYIETLPDAGPNGSLWFAYAIAKSESRDYNTQGSRYNQFLEWPIHTQDSGRPLWGNDGGTTPGGYGMFQVTGNASDSTADIQRKQIWNWQENIAGGLAIVASKQTTAVAWMNQQKNADNANGTILPNHTVGIVTFSEGTTRTMTNAVTIKLYNGASRAPTGFVDTGSAPGFRLDPQGSGHYCFWRNASSEWGLNRFNDPPDPIQPFNYVARVCEEVEN